ncbi:sugar kinase [Candidatus Acetothermia bacterium]|nr:sugar kinase [Candidatus Acetothermia bacterium]
MPGSFQQAKSIKKSPKLVVMGDLVLDVITRLPAKIIEIHRGTDTVTALSPCPGGAAANTARWLARLGADVHFISRVGKDALGQALLSDLAAEKIKTYVTQDAQHSTGIIVALVEPDGERSMLIGPAAHFFLDKTDVSPKAFVGAKLVYLSGYLFFRDRPRRAALHALELARKNKALIAIDPASAGLLTQFGVQRFLRLISGTDILLANLEEARLLAQIISPKLRLRHRQTQRQTSDLATEASQLLKVLLEIFSIVGLKLGSAGCMCAMKINKTLPESNLSLAAFTRKGVWRAYVPAKKIRVVDSTGCGDAWNAAFLHYLLKGAHLEQAAVEANDLAARVLRHTGAVPPGE